MRCWKCDSEPSETNPFLLLRVNITMQAYSCLPCAFETGNIECAARIQAKMSPYGHIIDKMLEDKSK